MNNSTFATALSTALSTSRATLSRDAVLDALSSRDDVRNIQAAIQRHDSDIKRYNKLAHRIKANPCGNPLYSYEMFRAMKRRDVAINALELIITRYLAGVGIVTLRNTSGVN